jgi:hypothetical protein
MINAAEGYARRTGGLPGGHGVRVGVVDGGIDRRHPDLGNVYATSWRAGGEPLMADPHGTFVAGVVGATRSQSGEPFDMHGVAYRATLVNIQAARLSVVENSGDLVYQNDDLVAAIRAAAGVSGSGVESDVINLSLGAYAANDGTFADIKAAMTEAAARDKIMVLAAGNEGLSSNPARYLQPIYPAAYADDAGIAGLAIVVGSLSSPTTRAATSNHCGDSRDYCLFAPGTDIISTHAGGGYAIGSGTSFAAPHVSGAAAVVKTAFPGVSNRDVVDRLLLTAADIGAAGVDPVFGRGRLDLEAAMAPVGPLGLPGGSALAGQAAPLEGALLELGGALDLGPAGRRFLARAVAFDRMGFPFPAGLETRTRQSRRTAGLEGLIDCSRGFQAAHRFAGGALTLGLADRERSAVATESHLLAAESAPPSLVLSSGAEDPMTVFLAVNQAALAAPGNERFAFAGELLEPASFLAPFERIAGPRNGAGMAVDFADGRLSMSSSISAARPDPSPMMVRPDDRSDAALHRLGFSRTIGELLSLDLGLGLLRERDGFLGSRESIP